MLEFAVLLGVGGCGIILLAMSFLLRNVPFMKTLLISAVVLQSFIIVNNMVTQLNYGYISESVANAAFWLVSTLVWLYMTYLALNLLINSLRTLVNVARKHNGTSD